MVPELVGVGVVVGAKEGVKVAVKTTVEPGKVETLHECGVN